MAFELIEEMDRASTALEAGGVAYALCGGLALAIHGHPRLTQDIDILVRAEELSRAADIARGIGFDVVSREGLATMKRIAGRPQDLVDIGILEGTSDEET